MLVRRLVEVGQVTVIRRLHSLVLFAAVTGILEGSLFLLRGQINLFELREIIDA